MVFKGTLLHAVTIRSGFGGVTMMKKFCADSALSVLLIVSHLAVLGGRVCNLWQLSFILVVQKCIKTTS